MSTAPADAITFVELLDFECESCRAAFPAVEQLRSEYGDRVSLVARYFPILQPRQRRERRRRRRRRGRRPAGPVEATYQKMYKTQLQWVLLNVGSGGTDVCSGIVGGSPLLPVYLGAMSGAALGVAAQAFDPDGRPVIGELGELVITEPMPSMPVGFWGDTDGSHYRSAYFEDFPGVWRHGDWVRFSPDGSAVITGRSYATLNRGGVRLGTAEFYRVVEELPGVADSLVVHLEGDEPGGSGELMLFVKLAPGRELDDALRAAIAVGLRSELSPRHVPDRIVAVDAIPYTRTGKKLEVPVKRILLGAAVADVAAPDALLEPESLEPFSRLAHPHR